MSTLKMDCVCMCVFVCVHVFTVQQQTAAFPDAVIKLNVSISQTTGAVFNVWECLSLSEH